MYTQSTVPLYTILKSLTQSENFLSPLLNCKSAVHFFFLIPWLYPKEEKKMVDWHEA